MVPLETRIRAKEKGLPKDVFNFLIELLERIKKSGGFDGDSADQPAPKPLIPAGVGS